jgi:hypothetical protein
MVRTPGQRGEVIEWRGLLEYEKHPSVSESGLFEFFRKASEDFEFEVKSAIFRF